METKKCTRCGEIKPLSGFNKMTCAKDGHRPNCKVCKAASDKKRCEKTQKFIDSERAKGCECCGETRYVLVDFHHVNPKNKKCSVGSMQAKSIKVVQKEMDKCLRLCVVCHRLYHVGRLEIHITEFGEKAFINLEQAEKKELEAEE